VSGILTTCAAGFKSSGSIVPNFVPIQKRDGCAAVPAAHDVVAVEHGPRLVAGHRHGDALGHSQVHHAPHGRAPEVVLEESRHPGLTAGRRPGPAKVLDRLPEHGSPALRCRIQCAGAPQMCGKSDGTTRPSWRSSPFTRSTWAARRVWSSSVKSTSRPSSFFVVPVSSRVSPPRGRAGGVAA